MNANLGARPSYIWRSIWSARGLVEKGYGWRVGSGYSINIWNEPWLPSYGDGRVRTQGIDTRYTTVDDLIDQPVKRWKYEILQDLFDDDQASSICAIPLARTNLADELIWRFKGSGCYSVRSGYRVLRELAVIYWVVWFSRNKLVHEEYKSSINEVSSFITAFICEQDSICRTNGSARPIVAPRWEAPQEVVVKINFDSAFSCHSRFATSGIVAQDNEGFILAACVFPHSNVSDVSVAEALACLHVVHFAKESIVLPLHRIIGLKKCHRERLLQQN
ncbi:hypothetical protein GQ457_04G024700 [Hibiscus cannabinus]